MPINKCAKCGKVYNPDVSRCACKPKAQPEHKPRANNPIRGIIAISFCLFFVGQFVVGYFILKEEGMKLKDMVPLFVLGGIVSLLIGVALFAYLSQDKHT